MRIFDGKEYRDMTVEEIAARKNQSRLEAIAERSRPLTQEEVSRMFISQQINTIEVDDNTALRMKSFYPEWVSGTNYTAAAGRNVGFKVRRNEKLWRLRQEHTAQEGWEPENATSLWEVINETHDGTIDDPIPYHGNMALEQDKYYIQGSVIYLCNRDTVNPVYNSLSDLVGLYVEII